MATPKRKPARKPAAGPKVIINNQTRRTATRKRVPKAPVPPPAVDVKSIEVDYTPKGGKIHWKELAAPTGSAPYTYGYMLSTDAGCNHPIAVETTADTEMEYVWDKKDPLYFSITTLDDKNQMSRKTVKMIPADANRGSFFGNVGSFFSNPKKNFLWWLLIGIILLLLWTSWDCTGGPVLRKMRDWYQSLRTSVPTAVDQGGSGIPVTPPTSLTPGAGRQKYQGTMTVHNHAEKIEQNYYSGPIYQNPPSAPARSSLGASSSGTRGAYRVPRLDDSFNEKVPSITLPPGSAKEIVMHGWDVAFPPELNLDPDIQIWVDNVPLAKKAHMETIDGRLPRELKGDRIIFHNVGSDTRIIGPLTYQ